MQRRLGTIAYYLKCIYRQITQLIKWLFGGTPFSEAHRRRIGPNASAWDLQEAKLQYLGKANVQKSLLRFDEREIMFKYIGRQIWNSTDEKEAVALIVCPICLLILIKRQCQKICKNLKPSTTDET